MNWLIFSFIFTIFVFTIGLKLTNNYDDDLNFVPGNVKPSVPDAIQSASSVVLDGSRKKLVIDHDGGADDAVAITMALLYEKYFDGPYVVGLTTTFGNVNLSQVLINTERILDLCDRNDVPIYSGAEGPLINGIESDYFFGYDGLGDDGYQHGRPVKIEKLHSALALIELSKKYEGDLIVVVIGPATNIALAIRLDPDFMGRISQIYLGGGYVPNIAFPDAEFNVGMDPEAYYIVVDAAKVSKTTFVPFSQIKYSMIIEKEWRKNILGAIQTPIVQALNGYERLSLAVTEDWSTLDPAVAAIVLNSNITEEYKTSNCSVSLCDQHGVTEFDFTSPEPNTRVFYRGNVETYKKFLIDVYSAELNTY